MFNLVFLSAAYVLIGRAGGGGAQAYHISMAILLVLLLIRYILFCISLALAWSDWEEGGRFLAFVPFCRYYRFGALSGSTGVGIIATATSIVWTLCLLTLRGSLVFALTSTIAVFTDGALAWLFASRADCPRALPTVLSALGLNFAAVWYINSQG